MVTAGIPTTTAITVAPRKLELVRPIASAKEVLDAKREMLDLIPTILKEGVDFGKLADGAGDRLCLFKAGAERLCQVFGAHPEYEIVEKEVDHDRENTYASQWVTVEGAEPNKAEKEAMKRAKKGRNKKLPDGSWVWQERGVGVETSQGLYRYVFRCRIVRQDGLVLAECIGSASTLEAKYISRPRDCENTVVKMSQKRAFVGAALTAFGLSDRFTSDVEDTGEIVIDHEAPAPTPPPAPVAKPSPAAQAVRDVADAMADGHESAKEQAQQARTMKLWVAAHVEALTQSLNAAMEAKLDGDAKIRDAAVATIKARVDADQMGVKALAGISDELFEAVAHFDTWVEAQACGYDIDETPAQKGMRDKLALLVTKAKQSG